MRRKAIHTLLFSVLVLTVLGTTLALAQDATTPAPPAQNPATGRQQMGGSPANRLQHMAQQLNLTDAQKAKIKPILQDEAQQLKALRNDMSITRQQFRDKIQEIRQATRAKIEPILTPEQVTKLPKPGTGQAGPGGWHRGRGMRGAGGGGNGLAGLSSKLNLTDDQKAKIQPLMADQQKQVQAIKQDTTLTPEQKQSKIQEVRKATRQQLTSILTPEQQQQMKQMMHGMRQRRGAPVQQQAPTPPPAA